MGEKLPIKIEEPTVAESKRAGIVATKDGTILSKEDIINAINAPETVNIAFYVAQQESPMFPSYIGNDKKTGPEILKEMGSVVVEEYKRDMTSRQVWEEQVAEQVRHFTQYANASDEQSENGSVIALPFITIACLQFHARAYEALIPAKDIVNTVFTGHEDRDKAQRVGHYMNYLLRHKMEEFIPGMDRSLIQLPVHGSIFRKTYYSSTLGRVVSEYCSARDVVVSYHAKDLESASRITHILYRDQYEINRMVKARLYLPTAANLGPGTQTNTSVIKDIGDEVSGVEEPNEPYNRPRLVLEQHRWWDLNNDGILEPYVITVDLETEQVFRITSRRAFDAFGKETILEYFTHYDFIPNPDGFYGLGLGSLLRGINYAANRMMRDVVDATTLANQRGGFYSTRAGIDQGSLDLKMGVYQPLDAWVDNLQNAFYDHKFEGPSPASFQILGMLFDYAKQVSTVSEASTGVMPSSDTARGAVLAVLEENRKLFSAIHKRTHANFARELKKIYRLLSIFINKEEYVAILGDFRVGQDPRVLEILGRDFSPNIDVIPVSDPNIISRAERLTKAQAVYQEVMNNPHTQANPNVVQNARKLFYEAMDVAKQDQNALIQPPPPPPDLGPHEENATFLREQNVESLIHQDHDAHLVTHRQFLEQYDSILTPIGKKLLERHILSTEANAYLLATMPPQQRNQILAQRQAALQRQAASSQAVNATP